MGERLYGKAQKIVDEALVVLEDYHPMTLRQVYYRLVARQIIANTKASYQQVMNALKHARLLGKIAWDWIEDHTRKPRIYQGYDDLADFLNSIFLQVRYGYHREPWQGHTDLRVECWLEKDALSSIFERECGHYYVGLNVGRGYDGWTSIKNAAERYKRYGKVIILYWGDFDPSGVDISRSLGDRLARLGADNVEIIRCALNLDDIRRYNLPPDPAKKMDPRYKSHIEAYGNLAVELDALPPAVLQERIRTEIEKYVDMELFNRQKALEAAEGPKLPRIYSRLKKAIPRLVSGT